MSEPLALVPLAAAAGGGSIDSLDARQLVAAGITVLQRCAPLVRALAQGRGAVLLHDSPAYLVALAACEGRGAVLLDPDAPPLQTARAIEATNARVVFTVEQFETIIPASVPRVYLDAAPGHATFVQRAEHRVVDLGSHFGFAIEGESDIEGSDEEAVIACESAGAGRHTGLTHRELLRAARELVDLAQLTHSDHALSVLPFHHPTGLIASLLAPLVAGAQVTTMPLFSGAQAVDVIERTGITTVAGEPTAFAAMASALQQRGQHLNAPALRLAISGGGVMPDETRARWLAETGVELREVSALRLSRNSAGS